MLPAKGPASRRVPRAAYPHGIERDYYRVLVAAVRSLFAEFSEAIARRLPILAHPVPLRQDGIADDLESIFAPIVMRWHHAAQGMRGAITSIANRAQVFNRKQQERQLGKFVGIDVFQHEPWLTDAVALHVRTNVALVKDIGDTAATRVERVVMEGVRSGASTKEIQTAIQDELGIAERRAALIAVDQVGKFNGQLTQARQRAAGIRRYRWRGMLDRRERRAHLAREGQVFSWDDPPPDGHPGEPVRCRCSPEPVVDDLFGDLFDDPEADDARETKAQELLKMPRLR